MKYIKAVNKYKLRCCIFERYLINIQAMKIIYLLLSIVTSNLIFAQTDKHISVPGTKCSIIAPAGFVLAKKFAGFQNENLGASIMITELPAPLQTIIGGFTAESLKAKGMSLIEKQTINFNKEKATLIKLSQQANGTTYLKEILIFGDHTKTVLVNGIYPEESKIIGDQIKNSLLSTIYNEQQNDNPLDAVKFKIDVSKSEFKLAKYLAGSLIYTTDGKIPTDKPTLIVGNSLSPVSATDKKQFCIDRLKQMPRGEQNVVKEINAVTIDNLHGFEIIADGKSKDGNSSVIYQVILFTAADGYFIIVGNAADDIDNSLVVFKNIAKTFKQK